MPDSPVSNTASVTTTNDGSDSDTDQVVVLAPDVRVVKNADNSPISAGDKAATRSRSGTSAWASPAP